MVPSGADDGGALGRTGARLADGVVGKPPARSPAHRDSDRSPSSSGRSPGPPTTSALAGLRAGGHVSELHMSGCGQGHFLEEGKGTGSLPSRERNPPETLQPLCPS